MYRARRTLILAATAVMLAVTAAKADCLAGAKARALVQSGEIVPMATAVRAARSAASGELIDGRLCSSGAGYRYLVTILGTDGKVARVTVDARSGSVLGVK